MSYPDHTNLEEMMLDRSSLIARPGYQLLFLALICYFTFFINNGALEPSIMEARNFVTAREMIQDGHWIAPTMNGEPRLAKPPLPTWVTAGVGLLVGTLDNIAALRIPAALMGSFLVLCLFAIARLLSPDPWVPFWSAFVAATSLYIMIMSRQGTWDIYAHGFMVGAILAILKGCRQSSRTGLYFVMAGMLFGLSFMSKGPVAFYAQLLPFGLSYGYGYGVGDFKNRWKGCLVAILICIVISAAWPLYLQWYEPEALAATATQEAVAWMSKRTRPFWHYWSFPIQSGIWALLATAALIVPYAKKRIDPLGNYTFLVAWVLIAVFLISLVPEKKERYLMPVLVPMALLTGHYIRYLVMAFQKQYQSKFDVVIVNINAIIFSVSCFVTPFLTYMWIHSLSILHLVVIIIVFVTLGLVLLRSTFNQQITTLLITISFFLASVCALILPLAAHALPAHPDYKNIAHLNTIKEFQGLTYYALERPHIQTAWTLGQRIEILPMQQGVLTRPGQLPAVLLSKHRLSASSLPDKGFQVTFYGVYPHHRTKPARKYYVYLLTPH